MPEEEMELELRRSLKLRLIQNPNYFGNLSKLDLADIPKAVLDIVGNTGFEELTCVGLNPKTDILVGIVEIKRPSGYGGDSCTPGSREYVRFYLDYGGGWVDHGVASFEAHDLGFDADLCYAVPIHIDPKKRSCCDKDPVLPRVRAILSWNVMPPANMPNWLPVWGNRLERQVQIAPRNPIICHFLDQFDKLEVKKLDPVLAKAVQDKLMAMEDVEVAPAPLAKLVAEIDRKDKMQVMRAVYPLVAKLANDETDLAAWDALKALKMFDIDIGIFDDFLIEPKFNTSFEELHCVGLDRDLENLHGVIQIKRPWGYSGDLCTAGSREYIAFYLDFGAGWEYQGTTWVDVHDIAQITDRGLWYQAQLPVSLEKHKKKWCQAGRARIRGILSWAVPPAPNQPEYVPPWGDREDCNIEIRPLPKGHPEEEDKPFIESIGAMTVDLIDPAGFATGASIGGTFTASDSPFGGVIRIAGLVAFPSSNNLEYRVMLKRPSDAVFKPWTSSFNVTVTTIIGATISVATVPQVATGDWFEYIPQAGPVFKSVAGNLLAPFHGTENGLHQVFIQVREQGTAVILGSSAIEAFHVDTNAPVVNVDITSGGGNCSKFGIGEVLVGTYSMSDAHARSMTLSVTPAGPAAGGHLAITSVIPAAPLPAPLPGPTASNGLSVAALTMTGTGASGNWELDTTGMGPCGYNIRIDAHDRTIVNSGFVGWYAAEVEGFCLE